MFGGAPRLTRLSMLVPPTIRIQMSIHAKRARRGIGSCCYVWHRGLLFESAAIVPQLGAPILPTIGSSKEMPPPMDDTIQKYVCSEL